MVNVDPSIFLLIKMFSLPNSRTPKSFSHVQIILKSCLKISRGSNIKNSLDLEGSMATRKCPAVHARVNEPGAYCLLACE